MDKPLFVVLEKGEHFDVDRSDDCIWLTDKRGKKRVTHMTKVQAKEVGQELIDISKAHREKPFFTYVDLANRKWGDLLHEAMKTFHVYFDTENNDRKGGQGQREIVIPQIEWKPTKCKFKCEMWTAGGDWQWPVRYFKCQLVDGYAFGVSQYKDSGMFIYIPGKEEGNDHLTLGKEGKWYAPDDEHHKKGIDPEPNERKCWVSLNKYLKELVEKEVVKVNAEREPVSPSPEGEVLKHVIIKGKGGFRMARPKMGESEKARAKAEKDSGEVERTPGEERFIERAKERQESYFDRSYRQQE